MIPNYSENPSLRKKVVVTVDGSKEYRVHCRLMKGKYYVKNKDCYEVDGSWYTLDSGNIIRDHETGKMVLKANIRKLQMVEGIVDYNDEQPVFGHYTPNLTKNTIVLDAKGVQSRCIDEHVAMKGGNVEDIARGYFIHPEKINAPEKKRNKDGGIEEFMRQQREEAQRRMVEAVHAAEPRQFVPGVGNQRRQVVINRIVEEPVENIGRAANYGELRNYGVEDDPALFDKTIAAYNTYPIPNSKEVRRYAKFLQDRTFGIEYETIRGYVPPRIQFRYGLIPLRDGSLHGGVELSSVPLGGARGLQTTNLTCNELSKRCAVNLDCSLHIHFGTLNETRLSVVAMYHLCRRIQDELFTMFPYYKTEPKGIKGDKNYCQKLKPLTTRTLPKKASKDSFQKYLDYYYMRIFTFLLEGTPPSRDYNKRAAVHPVQQKWNRMARYYWFNLMPTLLSTRRTVEFRLHQGTLNPIKTVNWLFICNAIIGYAYAHPREILSSNNPIALNEVLDWYADTFKTDTANFLSEYLNAYVLSRKAEFNKATNKGDYVCDWDLKADKTYTFVHKGVSSLF